MWKKSLFIIQEPWTFKYSQQTSRGMERKQIKQAVVFYQPQMLVESLYVYT